MTLTGAKHGLRKARRAVLKSGQYTLMRHIRARTAEEKHLLETGPRILANSTPKAGTNLLSRLLRMMPNTVDRWGYHIDETLPGIERQLRSIRRGQVVTAHFPWSEDISGIARDLKCRVFLMVRDPRDIAVSNVNYVTRMDLSHPLHPVLAQLPDDDARLLAMIAPGAELLAGLPNVWRNDGLKTFLPWLDEPNCQIVRFEDLVGAKGGGSDQTQHATIRQIATHIGADVDDAAIERLAHDLFGSSGSKTFHKGQIGGWKAYFNARHIAAFKGRSNETLLRMGYEQNADW